MLLYFWNILAQITEGESLKAPCMGGKNGGWNYGTFDAHCRNQGQSNGDGAFAEAGHVLYSNDSFHIHHSFLSLTGIEHICLRTINP